MEDTYTKQPGQIPGGSDTAQWPGQIPGGSVAAQWPEQISGGSAAAQWPQMDVIGIHHLEVFGNHGVFPEETKLGQKFLVNARLFTRTREAGFTDDLTKSIHYGEICHTITSFLREHTYHLIEAAAEHLAEHLLLETPRLWGVELEILKPWAPIGLPLKSVSVKISRSWHKAYIALGSNLGDKQGYLDEAVLKLKQHKGIRVCKVSDFMETEPYGGVEQDVFLNGCLEADTILSPLELLQEMNRIESEAGRERVIHWGPRTLDLDLIFYDRLITEEPKLLLPHPDLHNREFVLRPLEELCPYLRHPVTGKTVKEMLEEVTGCRK